MVDDVIIVGGGHVGLYTAFELARQGLRVRLLDQKHAIGERIVCTGIIGEEAFRRFDLPQDTVLGEIQRVRFFSPSGAHFDYLPPKVLARVVDRARFNQHFARKALDRGAQIKTGSRVEQIRIKKEGVLVKASDGDGFASYEARVLVLATGVNYKLFEWIGLQAPKNFLGGAQIHIPLEGEDCTSVYFGRQVAPGSFAWTVPLKTGVARVGLLSERNPHFYLKGLLDRIKPGWRDDVGESEIDLRPVVQGPLEKCCSDRLLVVGEAAGQIKTTTGGGIYYGLLGAQIAAETLKEAFRKNRFTVDVLSAYDRRWKKAIGEELRLGYYFRKLFAKLTDEQIEELFDRMIQEEILNLAYREAEFDWHKSLILSIFKLPAIRRVFQNPF
jgi:geranylgeranyl reductase family protein